MKREIQFVTKKYNWGWSVWIQVGYSKTLLADKLKTQEEVNEFIKNISNSKIIQRT